jgi:hypothetical protein
MTYINRVGWLYYGEREVTQLRIAQPSSTEFTLFASEKVTALT